MKTRTAIALAAAVFAAPTAALAATHAELRPGNTLALGASAQLAITVDTNAEPPPPPRIANARVRYEGQSSQISIVNGRQSQQLTFLYAITPTQLGALDIPAITVSTENGVESTAPLHATVSDSPAPAVQAQAAAPQAAAAADPEHAFVRIDVPAKSLVVGQAVPVTIRAYFLGGTSATLQGPPHVTSDAFTLSGLSDKPAQAQVEIRGEPYLQATWTGVLSPAKPTKVALGVELPVELAYRATVRRAAPEPSSDDPFSDPFFSGGGDPFSAIAQMDQQMSQMFDIGPMQQRDVTLRASAGTLAVTDLPATGKPPGFTGAVGHFALTADPIAGEPHVGEPLTVTLHVTGSGNFDRVDLAGVDESAELKTYAVKSTTVPGARPLEATKTFTQTIVPTRAGDLTIPAIAFSFFDPSTHAYGTATTAAVPLTVAASAGAATADAGLASATTAATSPAHVADTTPHATLVPRYRQAAWWSLPISLALLTGALVLLAWSRRSERIASVLRRRRVDREVARATSAMSQAATADDATAFFLAARQALQIRLADRWHVAREAITPHDIATRLGPAGAPIREVFEHADGLAYAPAAATHEPLDRWRAIVRDQLSTLEHQS
jgi:hypothetical protein